MPFSYFCWTCKTSKVTQFQMNWKCHHWFFSPAKINTKILDLKFDFFSRENVKLFIDLKWTNQNRKGTFLSLQSCRKFYLFQTHWLDSLIFPINSRMNTLSSYKMCMNLMRRHWQRVHQRWRHGNDSYECEANTRPTRLVWK